MNSCLESNLRNQPRTGKHAAKSIKAIKHRNTHFPRKWGTQQITVLDTALQEELTRALESLGSQLTSLSRRFVDDYSPLTEKLRDVVQMASNLPQPPQYQRPNREACERRYPNDQRTRYRRTLDFDLRYDGGIDGNLPFYCNQLHAACPSR